MKRPLLILLAALLAAPALAELSSGPGGRAIHYLTPAGKVWSPVRRGVDARYLLNPDGDRTGDGLPSFARNPATRMPEAVWARSLGDYEIAFSAFEGDGWRPVAVLTGNDCNDILPRLAFDPWGNRFITWASTGEVPGVHLLAGPARGHGFSAPLRLSETDTPARAPAAAVLPDGLVLIAFQEDRDDASYVVVVQFDPPRSDTRDVLLGGIDEGVPLRLVEFQVDAPLGSGGNHGGFPSRLVPMSGGGEGDRLDPRRLPTPIQGPSGFLRGPLPETDPEIIREGGVLWLEWLEEPNRLGFSLWDGWGFGEPQYLPLRGDRDTTREDVRRVLTAR